MKTGSLCYQAKAGHHYLRSLWRSTWNHLSADWKLVQYGASLAAVTCWNMAASSLVVLFIRRHGDDAKLPCLCWCVSLFVSVCSRRRVSAARMTAVAVVCITAMLMWLQCCVGGENRLPPVCGFLHVAHIIAPNRCCGFVQLPEIIFNNYLCVFYWQFLLWNIRCGFARMKR